MKQRDGPQRLKHEFAAEPVEPIRNTRPVRAKLISYLVLTLVFLVLQYPIGASHLSAAWGLMITLVLIHSVVMLADAACGLFDRNRPSWADGFWGLVLPVEPRGFPQLVALVGLTAAMFVAMGIRGCAGPSTLLPE